MLWWIGELICSGRKKIKRLIPQSKDGILTRFALGINMLFISIYLR